MSYTMDLQSLQYLLIAIFFQFRMLVKYRLTTHTDTHMLTSNSNDKWKYAEKIHLNSNYINSNSGENVWGTS